MIDFLIHNKLIVIIQMIKRNHVCRMKDDYLKKKIIQTYFKIYKRADFINKTGLQLRERNNKKLITNYSYRTIWRDILFL